MKQWITSLLLVATSVPATAQMADDGFTMDRGVVCTVLGYGQSKWTHYWEGTRYRNNLNIGTFKSQMIMPMVAYGITDRLNVFVALPYINNSSSAGTTTGKKGFQDISVDAKYKIKDWYKNKWGLTLFGTVGFSLPSNKYVSDFLPYSIGLGSKTATGRLIAHATYKDHIFLTAQAGYTAKSNITVDRITYYSDGQRNTNQMWVPNVWNGAVSMGYDKESFLRANITYRFSKSETGSDMRRNDMPLPTNKMNMQSIGVHALIWVPKLDGLGVLLSADQTFAGRNAGKSFTWMTGLQYFFTPFKKHRHYEM